MVSNKTERKGTQFRREERTTTRSASDQTSKRVTLVC